MGQILLSTLYHMFRVTHFARVYLHLNKCSIKEKLVDDDILPSLGDFYQNCMEAPNLNDGNVLFHFGNFALKAVIVFLEPPDSAFSKITYLLLLSHNSLQKCSCLGLQCCLGNT